MQNNDYIKNILDLAIRLQNLCEGFDKTSKSAVLTSKIKILLVLSKYVETTPSVIQENVGLAKSNITIMCNSLIKEGYVTKVRDSFDTREIFLQLTDQGKKYLDEFLFKANKNFTSELAYKNNETQIRDAVANLLSLINN